MTKHLEDGRRPVAVVAGAGSGNGLALAKRFSAAGYGVALLARDETKVAALAGEVPHSRPYGCDVTDASSVGKAFEQIRAELGEVDALLYNAGSGVFADVEQITPEQFEASWRVNALGGLLCSRQVMPHMKDHGGGSIVFIGATASRRGGVKTAAFASAKAAQRSLAESMARKLWPSGIHVALIILDGVVDSLTTRSMMPSRAADEFVDPAALAEIAYGLTVQNRQAWSFEVEARPFTESW